MPEQNAESSAKTAPPAPGKKKTVMILAIVLAVLAVQGGLVLVLVKGLGKTPAQAAGVEVAGDHPAEPAKEENQEIQIARLEFPHTSTGRSYVIRMTVYATVPKHINEPPAAKGEGRSEGAKKGEGRGVIETEIQNHIATIKDKMRTIVASADPATLCLVKAAKPDYGLSALRRQFKTVLEEVVGKDKIKQVLISDYMPTPMD